MEGCLHLVEDLIGSGGNAVFFHQVFGKDLAALDDGGVGLRAEAGDADFVQRIHRPQHQRIVRGHHGVVNGVFLGKVHNARNVRGGNVHALRVCRNASIAGQGIDFFNGFVLFQLLNDGVFPSTATNDQ